MGFFVTIQPTMSLDFSISDFFFSHRNPFLLKFFSWITQFGSQEFISLAMIIFIFWLLYSKQKIFVIPFVTTVLGSILFTSLSKIVFQVERPINSFISEDTFSFPSGHATISVALYGFIAYFIFRSVKNKLIKELAITICSLLIILIGFSRIYLGVHFFSDIYIGYLVGFFWLSFGLVISESIISHKRINV